jgi:hypothetical protein
MEDTLQREKQPEFYETVAVNSPSEMQLLANKINAGLEAFETRKAELTKLKEDAAGLTISSIEDKAAITKVSTWRKKLKAARVEIQKEGKQMRDPLTMISKNISAKEDELIDIISPTEKDLQSKEDWVKAEQDKIDQAEARRKQAIVQERIDKLRAYGFEIDLNLLTGISQDKFDDMLADARYQHEKAEAKKAEEARIEQERQEQILKDQEELKALKAKQAEADLIIKERQDELDRQAKAQKDREDEIAEKERAAAEEERKAKVKARCTQLQDFGLKFDFSDQYYKGYDCFVHHSDITGYDDEKWNGMIEKMGPHVASVKEEEARKAEEKRLQDIEDAKKKAIAEEKERQRIADQKKQEELEKAGDKAVWADFISKLKALPIPDMNSSQYRRMAGDVRKRFLEIYEIKP